jgi:hypothetical protein
LRGSAAFRSSSCSGVGVPSRDGANVCRKSYGISALSFIAGRKCGLVLRARLRGSAVIFSTLEFFSSNGPLNLCVGGVSGLSMLPKSDPMGEIGAMGASCLGDASIMLTLLDRDDDVLARLACCLCAPFRLRVFGDLLLPSVSFRLRCGVENSAFSVHVFADAAGIGPPCEREVVARDMVSSFSSSKAGAFRCGSSCRVFFFLPPNEPNIAIIMWLNGCAIREPHYDSVVDANLAMLVSTMFAIILSVEIKSCEEE